MPAVEAGVEPSLAAELELAAVPHEELVRRLYRLCLSREPEPDRQRFRDAGFLVFEDELYELTSDGWRSASADAAAEARYGERGPGASAVLCAELHPRTPSNRLRAAIRRRRAPTPE
jgi:hypothetical protein